MQQQQQTAVCTRQLAGRPRHTHWQNSTGAHDLVGRLPPLSRFQTPLLLLPLPPPLKSHRLILATEKRELEARCADACQESRKVASSYRRRRFLPPEMPSTTVRRSLQGHQKRAKKVKAIRAVFWQAFVGSSGDYFLSQNDCSRCCEVLEAAARRMRDL